MLEYQIKTLDSMIIVSSEGKTREEALSKLQTYLDSIHVKEEKFFFVELFIKEQVVGAMAVAKLSSEPEFNREFRSRKLKSAPYLLIDMSYETFAEISKSDSKQAIDLKDYLSKNNYRMGGIPFFEFTSDDESTIRVYIELK